MAEDQTRHHVATVARGGWLSFKGTIASWFIARLLPT